MIDAKTQRRIEHLFRDPMDRKIYIEQAIFNFKDATERAMHSAYIYQKGCLVHKETRCLN